jgi:hypothetical protein
MHWCYPVRRLPRDATNQHPSPDRPAKTDRTARFPCRRTGQCFSRSRAAPGRTAVVPADQNSSFFERIGANFGLRPVHVPQPGAKNNSGAPTPPEQNTSCEVNVASMEYLPVSGQSQSQIEQIELASFHRNGEEVKKNQRTGLGFMTGGQVQRDNDYRRIGNVYDEIYRAPAISHSDNDLMECYTPNIESARNNGKRSEVNSRSFSVNPNLLTAIKSTSGKNVGKGFEDKLDMTVSKDTKETKEETISPAMSGPGSTAKETPDDSKASENISKGNDTTTSSHSYNKLNRDAASSNRAVSVGDGGTGSANLVDSDSQLYK